MNVADFIEVFRQETGDLEEKFLWTDEEIVGYLNEAVNDAAERARLIEDSATPGCCQIPLTAATSSYDLHPSVLAIKRATLDGRPLCVTSVEAEDESGASWEASKGTPRRYIPNGQCTALRLVPEPVAAGTLMLTVYRLPLDPLTADNELEEPEFKPIFHRRLLDGVYARAYLKRDADTYDAGRAAEHETRFTAAFGERPSANVQRKRTDRRPPVVAFNRSW